MPRKEVKTYTQSYTTDGMKVSNDGSSVRMNNGHVYKRIVLPSPSSITNMNTTEKEAQDLVDSMEEAE